MTDSAVGSIPKCAYIRRKSNGQLLPWSPQLSERIDEFEAVPEGPEASHSEPVTTPVPAPTIQPQPVALIDTPQVLEPTEGDEKKPVDLIDHSQKNLMALMEAFDVLDVSDMNLTTGKPNLKKLQELLGNPRLTKSERDEAWEEYQRRKGGKER